MLTCIKIVQISVDQEWVSSLFRTLLQRTYFVAMCLNWGTGVRGLTRLGNNRAYLC